MPSKTAFKSGKKRFEKFVKSIAHPSRTFTCYIETETENINNYTLEIINRYLKIDKIVSDSALFYDYIMGYAQMLIKYHFKTLALLISKQAKKKTFRFIMTDISVTIFPGTVRKNNC